MSAMAGNNEIDFDSIAALVAILLTGTSANGAGVSLPADILKKQILAGSAANGRKRRFGLPFRWLGFAFASKR